MSRSEYNRGLEDAARIVSLAAKVWREDAGSLPADTHIRKHIVEVVAQTIETIAEVIRTAPQEAADQEQGEGPRR